MAQRGEGGLPKPYRPVTPPMQRQPSLNSEGGERYGDIDIFTDGDTASMLRRRELERQKQNELQGNSSPPAPPLPPNQRHTGQTTFDAMMAKSGLAGLQKGQREY